MKVIFPIKVYQRLRAYVLNTDLEISGLGRVEKKGKDFVVTEIRIFEQTVSGAHTTIDSKALGKFYDEIIQDGGKMEEWKLWWHSHNDMEAFFSATDVSTINDFDTEMKEDNWMLSVVTNHDGKIQARADVYAPLRCTISNLEWDISFEDPDLDEEIKKEIEEKTGDKDEKKGNFGTPLFSENEDGPPMFGQSTRNSKKGRTEMDEMYDPDTPVKDWRDYLKRMRKKKADAVKPGQPFILDKNGRKYKFNGKKKKKFLHSGK